MRRVAFLLGALVVLAVAAIVIVELLTPAARPKGQASEPAAEREEVRGREGDRPRMIEGSSAVALPAKHAPRPPAEAAQARAKPADDTRAPADEYGAALVGLELGDATPTELHDLEVPEGQTGVVVRRVDPASPAAEARLEKGDVIVRAQREKITTRDSLFAAVGARDHTLLTVYRDGFPFQVVLYKPFKGEAAHPR